MKRSLMVEGHGIPLDRVLAGANRYDSPLLAPTLDKLADLRDGLGPLPDDIAVHLLPMAEPVRRVEGRGRERAAISDS